MPKSGDQSLLLSRVKVGPRGADREPGHSPDVEGLVDYRSEPRKTPAFAKYAAVPHIAEQDPVKALNDVLWGRGCGRSLSEQANDERHGETTARNPRCRDTALEPTRHFRLLAVHFPVRSPEMYSNDWALKAPFN